MDTSFPVEFTMLVTREVRSQRMESQKEVSNWNVYRLPRKYKSFKTQT